MPNDFLSLAEAGGVLGVGSEQVRRYVLRGILPGMKMGNAWVVPRAHVRGLAAGQPRRGRPIAERTAWERIAAGDVDIGDPQKYANRGRLTRWSAKPGPFSDFIGADGIAASGIRAASSLYGALLEPVPCEAQVYASEALLAGDRSSPRHILYGLEPDPIGGILIRAVGEGAWDILEAAARRANGDNKSKQFQSALPDGALCAPPAAVALDLATSEHPRENDAAWAVINAG